MNISWEIPIIYVLIPNLHTVGPPVFCIGMLLAKCLLIWYIILENKCVFEFIVLKWIRITFADRGVKRWERFYE